jgi:FkbM family methyltransferase
MKKVNGWFLPDDDIYFDTHILPAEGWQIDRLAEFLKLFPGRTLAIDGGAHVGTWTSFLSQEFENVLSFEPSTSTLEALKANVYERKLSNVTIRDEVLWHKDNELVDITVEANTGSNYVKLGTGIKRTLRLDSLCFVRLDLIKLDLEGSEIPALIGAKNLVLEHKPAIIVENKPRHYIRQGFWPALMPQTLKGYGYSLAHKIGDDELWMKK